VHLDEIVDWIDHAFGADQALADTAEVAGDIDTLCAILGEEGYHRYLRDQVNRQIIRDYLTNAVVLGILSESGLAAFASAIACEESRATLALYMLMSAVEDAAQLPAVAGDLEPLKPLPPAPGDRSHIKLVPR